MATSDDETNPRRERLEKTVREIGEAIDSAVPEGAGFALFIFDFGEGGELAYVAKGERDGILTTVEDWCARMRRGLRNDA